MLTTYAEIRDRIYLLARQRGLRVDWIDSSRDNRNLALYDSGQVPVARAMVPVRRVDPDALARLARRLEGVFGKGVDELTRSGYQLTVRVLKKDGYWVGLPTDVAGGATADTLPELFAEIEFSKHFCAGAPKDAPVWVEYIPGAPEIAEDLCSAYRAFLALPPHLRPQAVAWDHDNDRPVDPAHTGPYLNLERMSQYT